MPASKRPELVIEAHGLSKKYRDTFAVRDLDLAIPAGAISAFLGPNGSGKTTTIRMLLGLAHPTAGAGRVLGQAISDEAACIQIRQRIGYIGEDKRLYGYMTVREILDFVRPLYPNWSRDREFTLQERFDLPPGRKCKKLSKGMRTKLALLLALARGADLLIFDEPAEGLDPAVAEQLLEAMVAAASDGATVFFSTHQISEVERIAYHVFIMNRGRLVFQNAMEEIRKKYRRIHFSFMGRAPVDQMNIEGVKNLRSEGHVLSLVANGNLESITQRGHALGAISVDIQPIGLREVFLETVNEERS